MSSEVTEAEGVADPNANDAGPPPLPPALMPEAAMYSNRRSSDQQAPTSGVPATPPGGVMVPSTPHRSVTTPASTTMEAPALTTEPEAVAVPETRRTARWKIGIGVAVAFALIGALALLFLRGESEGNRADRAEAAQAATADQLEGTERQLESSTADLSEANAELGDLELRISELTNEKAQVQDERNAAEELSRLGATAAAQMLDCRNRLLDAMTTLVGGSSLYPNYSGMSAQLDSALPICQAANSSVDAFVQATS